jgi:hypothetical protein
MALKVFPSITTKLRLRSDILTLKILLTPFNFTYLMLINESMNITEHWDYGDSKNV